MGKGVKRAVDNVNTILSPAVARANPTDLAAVDDLLWYGCGNEFGELMGK